MINTHTSNNEFDTSPEISDKLSPTTAKIDQNIAIAKKSNTSEINRILSIPNIKKSERSTENLSNSRPSRPVKNTKDKQKLNYYIPVSATKEERSRVITKLKSKKEDNENSDTLLEGATATALGAGAVLSTLPSYATQVALPSTGLTATGLMPLSSASMYLGVPALAGVAGYAIGKKLKHPIVGTLAGTAVGATGIMSYMPYQLATQAVGSATSLYQGTMLGSIAGTIGGASMASSIALNAAIPAGVSAGLYGLGRLHKKIWNSKKNGGILLNMARGCISPISIPTGLIKNVFKRSNK